MKEQYKYWAFISYKREDEKWAKWLQKKLEYYKSPVEILADSPFCHSIYGWFLMLFMHDIAR